LRVTPRRHRTFLLAARLFDGLIFLSLALVKRFHRIEIVAPKNRHDSKETGLRCHDLELVAMLGIATVFWPSW